MTKKTENQEKLECEKEIHKLKMEELRYYRETQAINHRNAMERHRIENAEKRKHMERKIYLTELYSKKERSHS